MDICRHDIERQRCIYCRAPSEEELRRRRAPQHSLEPGDPDRLSPAEIRAIPLHGRSELDHIETDYGVEFAKSVLVRESGFVVIQPERKHPSLNDIDGRTKTVHIDGHPNVWVIEEILRRGSNVTRIQVTPARDRDFTDNHRQVVVERGVLLCTGYARPELAWADSGQNRSPFWEAQRKFFLNLKGAQADLFSELLGFGFRCARMVERYFCLGDEEYMSMRALLDEFEIGEVHTFSMMVSGVIHYLDPTFHVSERSWQFVRELRRQVESRREQETRANARRQELERLGLKREPKRIGKNRGRKANLGLLAVLVKAQQRGYLDELKRLDENAYSALIARHDVSDPDNPVSSSLEEAGGRLGVSRERARQLEERALSLLGIDKDSPVLPDTGPIEKAVSSRTVPKTADVAIERVPPRPIGWKDGDWHNESGVAKPAGGVGPLTLVIDPTWTPFKIVLTACCRYYCVEEDVVLSPTRKQPFAFVRQVVMYLMRKCTDFSFPAIARFLNREDHTTVIHGFQQIQKRMRADTDLVAEINYLLSILASPVWQAVSSNV